MMRISPLGIFGANYDLRQVAEWARQDAVVTHPNPVCLQANALFAMAIAHSVSTGCGCQELHRHIEAWAREMDAKVTLRESISRRVQGSAERLPPSTGMGSNRLSQRAVATSACSELGGRGGGYRHARRGHRYECGYCRRTPRRCIRPGGRSRPVGREDSELSSGGWTAAHTTT